MQREWLGILAHTGERQWRGEWREEEKDKCCVKEERVAPALTELGRLFL